MKKRGPFNMVQLTGNYPQVRMRRLRSHSKIQELVRETRLQVTDLILPLFIRYGAGIKKPIVSLPGHYQISIDNLYDEIAEIKDLGIPGVILFGIPESKDPHGKSSLDSQGVIQNAI